MAEAVLRSALAARGVRGVRVASAGTGAREGATPVPDALEALAERGYDGSGHRARRLTPAMVEGADLVLAMAAEHRDEVVRLLPQALTKTFTLKEFVSLLQRTGKRLEEGPGERLRAAAREAEELRRSGEAPVKDEDVADPLGLPLETYRATLWEVEDLVERMVERVFGPADESASGEVRAGEPVGGTDEGGGG